MTNYPNFILENLTSVNILEQYATIGASWTKTPSLLAEGEHDAFGKKTLQDCISSNHQVVLPKILIII